MEECSGAYAIGSAYRVNKISSEGLLHISYFAIGHIHKKHYNHRRLLKCVSQVHSILSS